jgi:hypothetical protein
MRYVQISLEVNAEKTKYIIMSPKQHAGQNHNIRTGNKSFETVDQFRYLGATVSNQGSLRKEIKSRLNLANT